MAIQLLPIPVFDWVANVDRQTQCKPTLNGTVKHLLSKILYRNLPYSILPNNLVLPIARQSLIWPSKQVLKKGWRKISLEEGLSPALSQHHQAGTQLLDVTSPFHTPSRPTSDTIHRTISWHSGENQRITGDQVDRAGCRITQFQYFHLPATPIE
jgi:hypothetical protein